MEVIKLEKVSKVYGTKVKVTALQDIDLSIEEGEFVAIVGPSGSGKTTLLTIMGTLAKPTSGKVYVYGNDVTTMDDDELSKVRNSYIGFVFQNYNLVERMSAVENVELPLIARGVSKRERRETAMRILETLGLGELAYKKPTELSGGQQQRVSIARALAQNPKIVLADEPTANLDSKSGETVLKTFQQANREFKTTVVIITHDPDVASYARRRVHLRDGRIERID
ncbi:ABC-type antimicrobial peptide transport system, ATPase component [Metallosphaera yellowstonensis MK1]|jgi:putative ABC transport system ATP-binding protein|uniref:ABC-type antimicrobial peptide transport system, ATPase component n=1 Tax=Metallosphaera yellowstonensis MK1 TaxID=671065 RepID=H2C7U0_9CREN|nr:ABC transporter ATP-binding protein [Metallosphaera yellowstonensis]EHP68216.1 ABC-type antimicrobial peptide transport system, ATPase component [Metallosphaera yellowstonensis MK1]